MTAKQEQIIQARLTITGAINHLTNAASRLTGDQLQPAEIQEAVKEIRGAAVCIESIKGLLAD
jgi:hypothetical protein